MSGRGAIRYDECPCHRFSLDDDLDDESWTALRRRAKIPDHMGPRDALANLELLTADGGMTNAGAWLLAKDIRRFHLSAHLTCALFFGTTKTEIINRSDLDEDLCSIIDGAVEWVRSRINVRYIITGERVNREERPELPLDAVREAVVNAVAHRDYRSTANIQVCLYHDRLEVVSPGGLPPGMTEAELGTKSVPRNRLLFGVLHRMDKVEHIGTGIRRIRDLCRKWGVPAPVIDVSENWVTVTFRRIPIGSQGLDTALRGGQLGTRSAPSRDSPQVAGAAPDHGADGGSREEGPHHVQEPDSRAAAGSRMDGDDHTPRAGEHDAEVSDHDAGAAYAGGCGRVRRGGRPLPAGGK